MNKKRFLVIVVVVAIIGVSIYFAMFGGSGVSRQSNEPIKATGIESQVVGDTVSIPVSEVESNVWISQKTSVPYEVSSGNIAMKGTDLVAAYQNTIEPGWP